MKRLCLVLALCVTALFAACASGSAINEERAKEIAYNGLLAIQKEIDAAGTIDITEDSGYVFVGGDFQDFYGREDLPAFKMELDSMDDVVFSEVKLYEGDNAWNIEVLAHTSWGGVGEDLDFVEVGFKIDCNTGETRAKPYIGRGRER